jgi:pSer/pThr/pTyr-binding forkhead associated (FHA) protein
METKRLFRWLLHVKGETALPREIPLERDPVCFGRGNEGVDIALRAPDVSRRHAMLWLEPDGQVLLHDLHSTNGTEVNGLRIAGVYPVKDGDEIRIGRWRFEVRRVAGEGRVYRNRLPGFDTARMRALAGHGTDSTQVVQVEPTAVPKTA